MTPEEKVKIIKGFAEEIVTEEELLELFKKKENPVAYDGFEPSGIAPLHFGLYRAITLKKINKLGIKVKLWVADYHAFLNNKMGGDLEKIKRVGEYFVEVWKACGVDTSMVEIAWASDRMNKIEYWDRVLRIARETTVARTKKAITIMGRTKKDDLSTAQLFYPAMQASDIFELDVDICQLGMDQRRANMLARDVAPKFGWKKPVAVHHHLLMGLKGVQDMGDKEATLIASKMSKSDPTSSIYMHDEKKIISEKIQKAYCPPKEVEGNPILDYMKYIIFQELGEVSIERTKDHGGDIKYQSYEKLEKDYENGDLHPNDLKNALSSELDELIKPARDYFKNNSDAKKLYEEVKGYQTTR